MSDRRLTAANGRVADHRLRGQVMAERFVQPEPAQVTEFAAGLHAAPDGPLDRQMLFGDLLDVFERRRGWAFVRAHKDGYCGYVLETALGSVAPATHTVCLRQTHVYPEAGFKAPPLLRLPFGARVRVTGGDAIWARMGWSGGEGLVHRRHLRPLGDSLPDPATTAALFLGTPYLWAGNTGDGIDCSGLVQVVCLAAGLDCPGDSDQQEKTLGAVLSGDIPLQRNDVLFWKGHVALAESGTVMIHATAASMAVVREDIAQAIARIAAAGDGPVTQRRRLPL